MKITVYMTDQEASRQVEDDEENVMEAYRFIIKRLEQILGGRQIRYIEIDAKFGEKKYEIDAKFGEKK